MNSTTRTSSKVAGVLAVIAGALVAVSGAGAGSSSFGSPDGWTTRALQGPQQAYGAPDGWTTRALEGSDTSTLSPDSRPVSFATKDLGPADGWTMRALQGPQQGYGALDGWMARALSPDSRSVSFATKNLGPADGWTTRALQGPQQGYGAPDGWTARALTPLTDGSVAPDSRSISFRPLLENGVIADSTPEAGNAGGFDYSDAGIGAGAALAALLFAGLGAALIRHTRTHPRGRLAQS